MEIKTISKNKNNSLKREEFVLSITADKNPSKKDVIEFLKSDAELTNVRQIRGSFGKNTFDIDVVVYDSKEEMAKSQPIPRKVRKKAVAEAKKAAQEARAAGGAK
jgi:ribosomal protein S24E